MRTIAGTTWSVEDARAYIKARVKVDENGCWIWQRALSASGYGRLCVPFAGLDRPRRVGMVAHRASYEAFCGPIDREMDACHRCDVRACVNPSHIFAGSRQDNVADMVAKGRNRKGADTWNAKLTDEDVRAIRASNELQRVLAKRYNINQCAISEIKSRKRWAHVK
jgi:hypothetical protein